MNSYPQAATIAGIDSGGGAGVNADVKTMQERHVFSATIIVAVTAQNTLGVQDFEPVSIKLINEQFKSLADDLNIRACKTGMLADAAHVHAVAQNLQRYDFGPYTLDPVMVAKGGAHLLSDDAIATVRDELIPLATVVTPNLPETEALTGGKIESEADMQAAGHTLQQLGAKNVVVKGGHGANSQTSSDFVLLENGRSFWLSTPRIATKNTHGTGDTFASCITAELAKGKSVEAAIRLAKAFIQAAIADGIDVGHGHGPTNHWAFRKVVQTDAKD
ncbi:bifunctional hydroxymethylpyrimidine kinase/phosphomethylpyrimidine kinase [Loigolactobacillus backii]|uniref:Hydroxymethylpyrimidine/phosphomethylpyrimidine kinase n=1 Tax=Loigolactobacillus backii TaxID=375175 RepID=A0A192H0F8_9LACO|nr:bifunctional hydroxymethylpyrimidine kinase/phosphomethylpyrimidine kinase [Loigolactobacillus backii]ANK60591.1 hydroxymethylpyrimidine/phosphomethylpyrimidine kinase [Loigolactobacillus backii]ANK61840.1 hydroxymethylpyrimidine/phosphomethylpyrimidine kinase [Loigolactobacillus backii]ANK65544.1 hydroxymethylpyrimidine/phosphomethylpyrimidine kinase [Loigolactobacillus backii]ANK68015.1 hydroxymethylpyrimidine/phosphomethylpyrimidine kinase [Loigolactobacillus backii]ANK68966.1 hydroxymet